ncbi:DUF4287 domain-containing protein [Amycolatopsis sp. NPDC058986]|uniref:DUF4287 domain-containing protein n=1 Tax=unclassified Amycolatopsis TaxID=2618356 RepID=UPI00366A6054
MSKTLTTTEAVQRATGRDWAGWNLELDTWGAAEHPHKDIVAWLVGEHGLGNWWAQTITVEYERARGLRAPGSGRDGRHNVSASKTVDVAVEDLYAAVTDEKLRAEWLPDGELRERTSQPHRSARFDWGDGMTRVNVGFVDKGGKAQVGLIHERLADAAEAEKFKTYWRERLAVLKELLEQRG